MSGYGSELLPAALPFGIGAFIGIISFGILMLVLMPVLLHKSKASMLKGFLAVSVSFLTLSMGLLGCLLVARESLLVFLAGELAAFFVCWIALAVYVMAGR